MKGENVGNELTRSQIIVIKYEMEDGFLYNPFANYGLVVFSINPGRNETELISCPEDSTLIPGVDRDFLPISKVYLIVDNSIDIVLNVF